jgi:hypothetical protein
MIERLRSRIPTGSKRRKLFDSLFMPVGTPDYFQDAASDLIQKITPRSNGSIDGPRAASLLSEVRAMYLSVDEVTDSVERRATTLEGAVAIAGSLVLAGASLVADPSRITYKPSRVVLAVLLIFEIGSLCMAGLRALQVFARVHAFKRPLPTDIFERSKMSEPEAQIELTADLLQCWAANKMIVEWKVAHLGAAAWWFRFALLGLVGLTVAVATVTFTS